MGKDKNKPQDTKPAVDKPKPDPKLISHVEKGYTPGDLEKRKK